MPQNENVKFGTGTASSRSFESNYEWNQHGRTILCPNNSQCILHHWNIMSQTGCSFSVNLILIKCNSFDLLNHHRKKINPNFISIAEHPKITFIESLPAIDINEAPPFNKTAVVVQHAMQPTQLTGTTNATPSPSKVKPSPPTITITTEDDGDKSTNGMLDRISHDLDFLLNRTMEIPVRRANGNFQNQQNDQTDKCGMNPLPPPNLSVHEVILEECED